jgi:hypothetical protein
MKNRLTWLRLQLMAAELRSCLELSLSSPPCPRARGADLALQAYPYRDHDYGTWLGYGLALGAGIVIGCAIWC